MLAVLRTYTGVQQTTTAALPVVAFAFIPGLFVSSLPFEACAACIAVACSGVCLAFGWFRWRWHSEESIPSIAVSSRRPK